MAPEPKRAGCWDLWLKRILDTPLLEQVGASIPQASAVTDLARAYQFLSKESAYINLYVSMTQQVKSIQMAAAQGEEISQELSALREWLYETLPKVRFWLLLDQHVGVVIDHS